MAPYLVNTVFGGSTSCVDIAVYLIGPLAGGALTAVVYQLIARPEREVSAEVPQGAEGEIRGRATRGPEVRADRARGGR
jgi:hypothetical protein